MDEIIVSPDKWEEMFNWSQEKAKNRGLDLLYDIPFSINEGKVISGKTTLVFKKTSSDLTITFFHLTDELYTSSTKINSGRFEGKEIKFTDDVTKKMLEDWFKTMKSVRTVEELADFHIAFVVASFYYITEYRDVIERVKQESTRRVEIKKKRGKKIKQIIRVGRYYIYLPDENKNVEMEEKTKRMFQVECWGVRGHWRQLKNGRRIWIKNYDKGQGRNDGKIYKID